MEVLCCKMPTQPSTVSSALAPHYSARARSLARARTPARMLKEALCPPWLVTRSTSPFLRAHASSLAKTHGVVYELEEEQHSPRSSQRRDK